VRNLLVYFGALIVMATAAFADDNVSTVPAWAKGDKIEPMTNGRFQIFMSTILAKNTFLVDTVTGKVWQLVEDKKGVLLWQEMKKE